MFIVHIYIKKYYSCYPASKCINCVILHKTLLWKQRQITSNKCYQRCVWEALRDIYVYIPCSLVTSQLPLQLFLSQHFPSPLKFCLLSSNHICHILYPFYFDFLQCPHFLHGVVMCWKENQLRRPIITLPIMCAHSEMGQEHSKDSRETE